MPVSIAQKFKIKPGNTIFTINAPEDYKVSLGDLPVDVTLAASLPKTMDQVHWFVKNKTQLEKELEKTIPLINEKVLCWIFYPKGTSKIQTDLTRDKGWEELLKHNLQWINLVSFNETWSAFGVRLKTSAAKKKEAMSKPRPIFDYIDPKTKTVHLPDDFAKALHKNKKQQAFFNTLSFTNKKEYVEWIITAKKEEVRLNRVNESITRLSKEWKNPSNR